MPISLVVYKLFCSCIEAYLQYEPDGIGLGTCWGRELACKMFAEAGFKDVNVNGNDSFNFLYTLRKEKPKH